MSVNVNASSAKQGGEGKECDWLWHCGGGECAHVSMLRKTELLERTLGDAWSEG